MAKKKEDRRSFDERLGRALKNERKDCGYGNIEDFLIAVKLNTGVEIKKDALRKIESGFRYCTVEEYAAIRFTLDEHFQRSAMIDNAMSEIKAHYERYMLELEFDAFASGVEMEAEYGNPYPDFVMRYVDAYRKGAFKNADTATLYRVLRLCDSVGIAKLLFAPGSENDLRLAAHSRAFQSGEYNTPEKVFEAVKDYMGDYWYSKEFPGYTDDAEHAETGEPIEGEERR